MDAMDIAVRSAPKLGFPAARFDLGSYDREENSRGLYLGNLLIGNEL